MTCPHCGLTQQECERHAQQTTGGQFVDCADVVAFMHEPDPELVPDAYVVEDEAFLATFESAFPEWAVRS